jgi:hypothetical protein
LPFGSQIGPFLIIIGLFMAQSFPFLMTLGIYAFAFAVFFQIVTLPVEFDASKRALAFLEGSGILSSGEEITGAKRMLSAAALTYVAAALTAILTHAPLRLDCSGQGRITIKDATAMNGEKMAMNGEKPCIKIFPNKTHGKSPCVFLQRRKKKVLTPIFCCENIFPG